MLVPGVEIPHLCFQCEDYPCVGACPVGALSVNGRTGAVNVDFGKCTACGRCVEACPGRVPHIHPEGDHVLICDLCAGTPQCVKTCQDGRWNTLVSIRREKEPSRKRLARTPLALTHEVAKKILGEKITGEVLGS